MKVIGQYINRIADLLEAEGRVLRETTVHVGLALALALGAVAIGVGGLGLVAWGVFEALRSAAGFTGAALICGIPLLAIAGGLAWIAIRVGKGR